MTFEIGDRFRLYSGSVEHVVKEIRNNQLICYCESTSLTAMAHPSEGRKLCRVASYLRARNGTDVRTAHITMTEYADWLTTRAKDIRERPSATSEALTQAQLLDMQASQALAFRDSRYPRPRY